MPRLDCPSVSAETMEKCERRNRGKTRGALHLASLETLNPARQLAVVVNAFDPVSLQTLPGFVRA